MKVGNKAYYYLLAITIFVIAFGTVFFHHVEKWNWIDAYYFCVITLTTVGYGDFTPTTPLGRLFTTFYLMIGIGIITFFITTTAKRQGMKITNRYTSRQEKKKNKD